MKKRIISIALVVAMIVVMIPAMLLPTAAIDWYNGYVTGKVNAGAINIDAAATPDAAYANSEKIVSTLHYDNRNDSKETSSFYGYTAADELGVYFWFNITDQSLNKGDGYDKEYSDPETMEDIVEHFDPVGPQTGDKFQIYIKAAGAMSSASRAIGSFEFDYIGQIAPTCVKYPINYPNVNGDSLGFDASLVDFKVATYENAWVLEAYIPFAALGGDFVEMTIDDLTGYQVGLQANNMTNDDKAAHNAYCYDTSFGGGYYLGMSGGHGLTVNASHQGSHCVPLSFAGFTTAVVTTAPVVDGKMDASYLKSEKIDAYDAAGKGKNFTAYTAATAEGMYFYADIIDDTLDKAATTVVGSGDKFQVYFQMGNRFSNRDWGYVEMDYRTEGEYTGEGDAVNFRIISKGSWADNTFDQILKAGAKYATTKKADGSGWTAELFLPWAGRMAENNFDELTGTTVAIGLQVNNYTDAGAQQTYCLSDAFAGGAWYAYNGANGGASGNFFCAPVIFDFDTDKGAKNIIRWANYSEADLVLDGTMDAAYNELASEVVDFTYVHSAGLEQSPEFAAEMGWETSGWKNWGFATAYYAFTDTDVYVFVDVEDDTVAPQAGEEFVSIFFENSDSIAKFALSPFNGGTYITNTTYFGKTVSLPATNSAYAENDKIALKFKGDADAYTGYTVEFKLPLTDTEKAALAAGEAISIGIGLQTNDSFENAEGGNTRRWYSYNVPYGNLWWQNGADILGGTSTPKVRLDKALSANDFAVEPEITAAQVALGESITVNYFANLPVDKAATATMKFTFNGEETIVNAATTATANEYVFAFEGIAPQCMGDNIAAELIVDGEVVDAKAEYSVFQNCLNLYEAGKLNAAGVQLILDLGAYGAAAQLYAGYKTDDLVNEGYADLATKVDAIEGFDRVVTADSDAFLFTAAGVWFDNTNKLYAKMYIDAEALEYVTVTINGAVANVEALGDDLYIVYTEEILVTEFADEFTFVITDGADEATLVYSVNAYCQAKLGNAKNPAAATLAAATYAYGVSALAYAG